MITLDEGTQDYIKEFKVKEKPVYSFVKRAFDFGASLVGLVCLSPVLLVTGVAIKLESEGPIIFSQLSLFYFFSSKNSRNLKDL